MKHILLQMLSQMTHLNKQEEMDIAASFPIKSFAKGHHLLKQGQIAKEVYFVITGCIREYTLRDGDEITTEFYTERQSVADFDSLANRIPTTKNLVCTEETTLTILTESSEQALYRKYPRFETFCRSGMEQMLGQKQSQLQEQILLKPKQRFLKLQQERPDLLNRVPQYQIASYLGIKPETLSRIRAKTLHNE